MKRLQKVWGIYKGLALVTVIFWVLETVVFIIIDGWHVKPIRDAEKACDNIVQFSLWICALMFLHVVTDIVNRITKD